MRRERRMRRWYVREFSAHLAGQESEKRILHAEALRAPEPVCVPTPNVRSRRKPVFLLARDGSVVDPHVGIVARVRRGIGELAHRGVHLCPANNRSVEIVRVAEPAHRRHVVEVLAWIREPRVSEMDIALRWDEPDFQAKRIAQCAVRVRKPVKEVWLPGGRANHEPAIAQQDFHLLDGLVHQAESE